MVAAFVALAGAAVAALWLPAREATATGSYEEPVREPV